MWSKTTGTRPFGKNNNEFPVLSVCVTTARPVWYIRAWIRESHRRPFITRRLPGRWLAGWKAQLKKFPRLFAKIKPGWFAKKKTNTNKQKTRKIKEIGRRRWRFIKIVSAPRPPRAGGDLSPRNVCQGFPLRSPVHFTAQGVYRLQISVVTFIASLIIVKSDLLGAP